MHPPCSECLTWVRVFNLCPILDLPGALTGMVRCGSRGGGLVHAASPQPLSHGQQRSHRTKPSASPSGWKLCTPSHYVPDALGELQGKAFHEMPGCFTHLSLPRPLALSGMILRLQTRKIVELTLNTGCWGAVLYNVEFYILLIPQMCQVSISHCKALVSPQTHPTFGHTMAPCHLAPMTPHIWHPAMCIFVHSAPAQWLAHSRDTLGFLCVFFFFLLTD